MIRVEIYPLKKTARDMLELLQVHRRGMTPRMTEYMKWVDDNNIVATHVGNTAIDFESEEDAVIFKLKFGL